VLRVIFKIELELNPLSKRHR